MSSFYPSQLLSGFRPSILSLCLVSIVVLSSCGSGIEICGSVDTSNEHEGGPSAGVNGDDLGYNVSAGLLQGLAGKSSALDAENDDFIAPDMKDGFALSSKLQFIKKGSSFQAFHTHLNYLEVVEDVLYQHQLDNKSILSGGLGPYLGYGIGGNSGGDGVSQASFGGQDGYKRFDAGLSLMGRYQLPSSLSLGLEYQYGLVNKSPEPDFTSRNRTFSFNVGYSLDKILGAFGKK